jgi:excisionase family DNA binding protein
MLHDDDRITVSEAARLAGAGEPAVMAALVHGRLRHVRLGRRRVIRTSPCWVHAWLSRVSR